MPIKWEKPKLEAHRKMGLVRCSGCKQLCDKKDRLLHQCAFQCRACGVVVKVGATHVCDPVRAAKDRAAMNAAMGALNRFVGVRGA